uniref:Uncharacterized protein n=1 Tax=Lates calcarifer TaxID=8187 RepID=A0A4W6DQ77_LATCA
MVGSELSLILVLFCSVQGWEAPDFCHQKECPEYNVFNTNSDFEERQYVSTDWITTKVESTGDSDLLAAHSRLKDYCQSKGMVFTDRPSVKNGQDNAQELREALVKAGKSFDPHSYTGAGYDTYFSLTHHSEIWIYAA